MYRTSVEWTTFRAEWRPLLLRKLLLYPLSYGAEVPVE
jgi:hypothetical protein